MGNMPPCSTAFANFIIFFSNLVLSASNCYYPNGNLASTHTPCNVSAETSACCDPGDLCLSNGYCFQQFGAWSNRLARGSCTDRAWDNSICPYYCLDLQTFTSVSIYLAFENVPTGTSGFCCQQAYNVSTQLCQDETHGSYDPFPLDSGTAIYDRSNGSTLPPSTTTSSTSSTSTSVVNGTTTVKVTVTASAGASSNNTTTVAVGIAVPLGVLLVLAIIGCIFFWRKYKSLNTAGAQQVAAYNPGAGAQRHHPPQSFDYEPQQAHGYEPQQPGGYYLVPHELSGSGDRPVNEAPGTPVVRRKEMSQRVYR